MTSLHVARMVSASAVLVAVFAFVAPASADILGRESDIGNLRLGQRIYVDDGSCPAGQVKEIAGVRLSESGVERTRKCVDRKGKR